MVDRADLVGAIIAGGRARRLGGRVKALLEVDGEPILDRQLRVLAPLCREVVVSANDPAPFAGSGLTVIGDRVAGGGPIVGLASVLEATGAPWILAVASDMPHLRPALLELLVSRATGEVDAVVPFVGDLPDPLLALYAASALPVMIERIDAGRFRTSWLATGGALRVARVEEAELRAVDPELRSLVNVNRPDDLVRV